jgi:hypothetical protein
MAQIKLKECIVTPVDDDGMSPNWIQMFAVEESDHSYYWVVGMEDDRRFTLHFDFVDPAAMEEASTTYNDILARIRMIAQNKH